MVKSAPKKPMRANMIPTTMLAFLTELASFVWTINMMISLESRFVVESLPSSNWLADMIDATASKEKNVGLYQPFRGK